MRLLSVIIGLIFLINSSSADWLAYHRCTRLGFFMGYVTVENGNCVPGYFEGSSDRLLVSCGSGQFSVFRCTSKDCESGCNQIKQVAYEDGVCTNGTNTDGDRYRYYCSTEKPDFGRLVHKGRFLAGAFFAGNTTGWCAAPWRYEVWPENECYTAYEDKYSSNYQIATSIEKDTASRIGYYKDYLCKEYIRYETKKTDECMRQDLDGPAEYWSFQKSPPPLE